jgi:hypothetical protein
VSKTTENTSQEVMRLGIASNEVPYLHRTPQNARKGKEEKKEKTGK